MPRNPPAPTTGGTAARTVGLIALLLTSPSCGGKRDNQPSTPPPSRRDAAAPRAAAGPLRHRHRRGQERRYLLSYRNLAQTNPAALEAPGASKGTDLPGGPPTRFVSAVTGVWVTTVLAVSGDKTRLAVRISAARVQLSADGRRRPERERRVAKALAQSFQLEVDDRGQILAAEFPQRDVAARDLARRITAAVQFVLPAASETEWQSREYDAEGRYRARYRRTPSGGPAAAIRIDKTPLSHAAATIHLSGRVDATFAAPTGRLDRLRGRLQREARRRGRATRTESLEIGLRYQATRTLPPEQLAEQLHVLKPEGLAASRRRNWARTSAAELDPLRHRSALGRRSPEMVITALEKAERAGQPGTRTLHDRLAAVIFLHAEQSLPRLAKILARARPGGPALKLLGAALARVGSPAAQSTIIGALRARATDAKVLFELLQSAAAVRRPEPTLVETIEKLADTAKSSIVRDAAVATLGTMARFLAKADSTRALLVVAGLGRRLNTAKDAASRLACVVALGNSRMTAALAFLRPLLEAKAAGLRAEAVEAVAGIPNQTDAVVRVLRKDTSARVRFAAARALAAQTMTAKLLGEHTTALATERSDAVRRRLVRNLWAARTNHPKVIEVVKRLAQTDRHPSVQQLAARLVTAPR